MARLGRRHKEQVHKLLKECRTEVNFTVTWNEIYRHFEVGRPASRKLHFTVQDRNELRELAFKEWGFDPLHEVPDGTRNEVAANSCDDKLATERPNDHYLLIKSAQGSLPWAGIDPLPRGFSLRIPIGKLDINSIDKIVIIENQDSFDSWHQYQMPDTLDKVLTLYRGHDALATGVKNLIERLLPRTAIIVFPDLDPAGLQIACTTPGVTHLLIPELSPELVGKNNKEDYYKQHGQISYLEKADLKGWQGIWNNIKQGQTSIKQQHMLIFKAPLCLVSRQE